MWLLASLYELTSFTLGTGVETERPDRLADSTAGQSVCKGSVAAALLCCAKKLPVFCQLARGWQNYG